MSSLVGRVLLAEGVPRENERNFGSSGPAPPGILVRDGGHGLQRLEALVGVRQSSENSLHAHGPDAILRLMPPNPLAAVGNLFNDRFSKKTLERFIRDTTSEKLAEEINFDADKASVVFDTVNALKRHGWLKQDRFWSALQAAFENGDQEIVEVMGAWVTPPPRAAESRTRDPRDAIVPATPQDQLRIAPLAADVDEMRPLRVDMEMHRIHRELTQGDLRTRIRVEYMPTPTWSDLRDTLLGGRPHVLHFGGHGREDGSLLFATEDGGPAWIPAADIADLLRILQGDLALVVLNACYSKVLAERIAALGVAVIGMTGEVSDDGAIRFSKVLYEGLAGHASLRQAFDLGILDLRREGFGEELIPALGPPFP